MLCRSLLCFLFRTYQTTTLASRQSWREPACITSSILYSSLHFPFFKNIFLLMHRYTATNSSTGVVCTSVYVVVEPRAQRSTAQHSAIPAAQSSKPSTCRSEYISEEVCTYMHAASRLFSWSMELLAFASRLFAPKALDNLLYILHASVVPIHSSLWASVAGGTAVPVYSSSSTTAYATCMIRVSMLPSNRERSKAQHSTAQSPLHKAANNQVRTDHSTYQKKYVRMIYSGVVYISVSYRIG